MKCNICEDLFAMHLLNVNVNVGKFIAFLRTQHTIKARLLLGRLRCIFSFFKLLFLYEILSCICAFFMAKAANRKEKLVGKESIWFVQDLCKKEMLMNGERGWKGSEEFDDFFKRLNRDQAEGKEKLLNSFWMELDLAMIKINDEAPNELWINSTCFQCAIAHFQMSLSTAHMLLAGLNNDEKRVEKGMKEKKLAQLSLTVWRN